MGLKRNFISDSQACGDIYTLVVTNDLGAETYQGLRWNGSATTDCPAGLEANNPLWTFTINNEAPDADEVFGPYHAGTIPATISLTVGPFAGLKLAINSTNFLLPLLSVDPTSPIQDWPNQLSITASIQATDQCENFASAVVTQMLGFANPQACFTPAEVTPATGEFSFTDCSSDNGCSSGISSWSWKSYRVGSTTILWSHSGQTPPNYTYALPGTYVVELRVTTDCGAHTTTAEIESYSSAQCLALSQSDFQRLPWTISPASELTAIYVEIAAGSTISSIDTRPNGTLYDPLGAPAGTMVWNGGSGYYEPDTPPIIMTPGGWRFEVPLMTVTLATGAVCELGFQGTYLVLQDDSCSQLSANDWAYLPWNLNADGYLTSVDLVVAPGSIIASVDAYPAGVLKNEVGTPVDTMSWNGTNYVPDLGPGIHFITGTWTVEITGITVTTIVGQQCTLDFTQGELGTGDAPPVATFVVLDEVFYAETETATVSYVYTDSDPEDVAATVAAIIWKSYDGPTGAAGETTIQTGGLTYVVQAGDIGRFISATVTPYALTGASPGLPVETARSEILEIAFLGTTTKEVDFTIGYNGNTAQIDWGDGSGLESVDSGGIYAIHTHTYSGPGTYDWKVYADPTTIIETRLQSQLLSGTFDISELVNLGGFFVASSNASLTTILNPTSSAIFTNYQVQSCNLSTLDLSTLTGLGGNVWLYLNANLTSVTFPATTQDLTALYLRDCNITGVLDLTPLGAHLGGFLQLHGNALMTGATMPTTSLAITNFSIYLCNITGVLDLSPLQQLGGSINFRNNPNMTGITMPVASTQTPTQIYGYSCTSLTSIDFSGWGSNFGAATTIQLQNCSALTSVTFPTTSNAIGDLYLHTCDLTGTLNIGGLTGLSAGANLQIHNNSNLTAVTWPTSSPNKLASITAQNCGLTSTTDLSGMTGFTGNFQMQGNSGLTGVTFPTSVSVLTIFFIDNCDITGTLNIGGLSGLGGTFKANDNPNMTGCTMPASSGTIDQLLLYGCDLGHFDITGMTFSAAVSFRFEDNSMTAAEVNEMFVDLDSTLPGTGTGSILGGGTNAAPDTTSGGFDGDAAVANLIANGYTVSHS